MAVGVLVYVGLPLRLMLGLMLVFFWNYVWIYRGTYVWINDSTYARTYAWTHARLMPGRFSVRLNFYKVEILSGRNPVPPATACCGAYVSNGPHCHPLAFVRDGMIVWN